MFPCPADHELDWQPCSTVVDMIGARSVNVNIATIAYSTRIRKNPSCSSYPPFIYAFGVADAISHQRLDIEALTSER